MTTAYFASGIFDPFGANKSSGLAGLDSYILKSDVYGHCRGINYRTNGKTTEVYPVVAACNSQQSVKDTLRALFDRRLNEHNVDDKLLDEVVRVLYATANRFPPCLSKEKLPNQWGAYLSLANDAKALLAENLESGENVVSRVQIRGRVDALARLVKQGYV